VATDLRNRTIRGVGWTAISQAVTQGFTFVISIVLARILGPKAYGLIGMVTVFTGFAALFGGLGLGAAIIQRRELEPRHLDTAFWVNAVFGCAMTGLMLLLAPLIGMFYHEPKVVPLAMVISLRFTLDALNVVQSALLNREMRFRSLATVQIGASFASGLVGLGMALGGMGVWSLVLQSLGNSIVQLLLLWNLAAWRPRWSFDRVACRELFGFSAAVLGFDVANYWARTLDQLVIGRALGAGPLGIYSRAYSLMLMPLTQVSRVVGGVMFAAMSSIQDDKPRVKKAYLKAIGVIALITFPMMVGLFTVSDHFVLALLGRNWVETIPILRIFCWVGLLQSVLSTVGWIYTSQGQTQLYFKMGLVGMVACILAFLIGIQWGVMGVAWAYSLVNLLVLYPFFVVPARFIGLTFLEAVRCLSGTLMCALAMGAVVWGVGWCLPADLADWQCLLIQVPIGVACYWGLLAGFQLEAWMEARRVLFDFAGSRLRRLWPAAARPELPKDKEAVG